MGKYFYVFLAFILLLIPFLTRLVSLKAWKSQSKKIAISFMLLVSTTAIILLLTQDHQNLGKVTLWAGRICDVLLWLVGIISAYFSWPGLAERFPIIFMKPKHAGKKVSSVKSKDKVYVTVPFMTGCDGEVCVSIMDASFIQKEGGKKIYPDSNFGPWLMEEIYDRQKIMATKRGLRSKSWHCSSCRMELNPDLAMFQKIQYTLKYKDLAPFNIQFVLPTVECPQCSKFCAVDPKGTMGYQLSEAILQAFKSENI